METTFARWLRERGESHQAYAARLRLNWIAVRRLAGVGREPYVIRTFRLDFISRVAKDTGIPIDILVGDAERAAADPVPPRTYTRKEGGDGKDAQP